MHLRRILRLGQKSSLWHRSGHQGPRFFYALVWLEADLSAVPGNGVPCGCAERDRDSADPLTVSLLCSGQPGAGPEWHLHQHDQTDSGEVSARAAACRLSPLRSGERVTQPQPYLPEPLLS